MCAQCMAVAATTMGAATGLRAWVAARFRISEVTKRRLTIALMSAGVLAAGLGLGQGR